ncbi:hypothetical protein [Streptomyces sp. S1D4-20]|uniref:hypothetical protein n=1 Tax=Streptomyces sp. S1D4-20 TaxID=2594462 RepID=UPI0011621863|nr:hypothetical protein [Streptomyces sp. S1D4-20]QDN54215.1 hypothetical protein FNV67_01200 [Streptomyces sp. S1D4-20]
MPADEITPVSVDGFNGLDEVTSAGDAAWTAALSRWRTAHPGEDDSGEILRLVALTDVLSRYNRLRPRLAEEQEARAARDEALAEVETCWQALRSPGAWLAAHHNYVVAVDAAKTAIRKWRERALAAKKIRFIWDAPSRKAAYDRLIADGHPEVEPLGGGNPATEADRLLAELEQAEARRASLVAKTVAIAQRVGAV